MDIKEALSQLDTMEDSHWTGDGAPAVEVVSNLLGQKITRAEITNAAPKFTRKNTDLTDINDEKTHVEKEDLRKEEEVDTSILQQFSEMPPMLPNDLAEKVLKKIDPSLLIHVESMMTEQLLEIEKKESELEELKRRVKMGRALTKTWIKQLVPDISNQEAIRQYIRSSQKNRAKKSQDIKNVLGGLNPSDIAKLDPRATIDKAFARKTARGGQRPVR